MTPTTIQVQSEKLKGLRCRECGRSYPLEALHVCEFCFGPLEVEYDYECIRSRISRERIAQGPLSLWRYEPLLPVATPPQIGLHAGFTPLIRARNLGAELGLRNLFIKNDSINHPTLSFKDRVVAVALNRARELGFKAVACASTGNLANAVAALAAEGQFQCYVFIPGDLEAGKIVASLIYHPQVVAVDGTYDDVNRLCSEIAAEYPWAFVNINIRPYYAEGSKTLAFEVVEQLGWRAPDHVVVPVASGSLLTKIQKGLWEMKNLGLVEEVQTRVHGAQAEGCAPVATAFKNGWDAIRPVRPKTIAKSIAIGNPADGYYALKVVRDTGGQFETASDPEIVDAIHLLARTEGIFTETAGGVTIAVLRKLAAQGVFDPDALVVAYVTGNGLKTQEAVADSVPQPVHIAPSLDSFEARLHPQR